MSSKIAVLSLEVANRIAAGEVVERPSSAVKELVENAIDAGAGRITVEVAEAGRRHIRVTDDGEGMSQADAACAFLRHATSKIRTKWRCASRSVRAAGASCGTEISLEGGSIKEQREAPSPPGTMVEVADLFYNTPPRKKFLKSPATEFGHICQVIQRLALGFPKIHFRLLHNGASVLEFASVRSERERIQQIYGLSLVDGCVDIIQQDDELRLEGVSSRPLESGLSRTPQEMLVNQRWVKCPSLAHAVYYGSYLAKGRHPRFVLHLTIDPRSLDMNVHPAKREVRFSNQERLHEMVRRWIRDAVSAQTAVSIGTMVAEFSGPPAQSYTTLTGSVLPASASPVDRAAEATQPYLPAVDSVVQPLGQIAERYLLAQVGGELQIVDQHTAHERVLFERLSAEFGRGNIASQQALLPGRIELPASAAMVIRAHGSDLERLGFEVEDFGGGTFLLRAMPALLTQTARVDPESLLRALVEDWENEVSTVSFKERYHAALASMACHSAVRSGRRMESAEIRQLLEDWREAGLPSTCPHGRRVAMRLTIEDLDRIFGRQGWA